jgi:hypothetical protein
MVSESGLKQFKDLYLAEFGTELTKQEVVEKANRLLNLYKSVYSKAKNININTQNEEKIQIEKNYE